MNHLMSAIMTKVVLGTRNGYCVIMSTCNNVQTGSLSQIPFENGLLKLFKRSNRFLKNRSDRSRDLIPAVA